MRRFKWVPWLTAVLVALTQVGCSDEPTQDGDGEDTCTGGRNMTNPRLEDGLATAPGGASLRIIWDPGTDSGAQLSSDYFAAVQVSSRTAPEVQSLVGSVELTEERKLTVRFRNLGPYLVDHNTLEFVLSFPDRRDFISCTHAGMSDEYLLRVRLEFSETNELQGAVLTEELSPGDI